MVRKARVKFEEATDHVMCRGSHQAAIFRDARDKEFFFRDIKDVDETKEGLLWKIREMMK